MSEKRISKHWTANDVEPVDDISTLELKSSNLLKILLSLKDSNITYTFMMNLLGEFAGETLCRPYDTFDVPIGRFKFINEKGKELSNTNKFTTTIGIWIFNIYFLRDDGLSFLFDGYFNQNVGKKQLKKINQVLSYALMEDRITVSQLKRFVNKTQWIMPFETVLAPNHSEKMLTCTKAINKKKMELYKKYKKDIDSGKADIAEKMEKELLAYAKEYMGDDPAMDMFLSGGGGSYDNNFKNLYIMKGPVRDPDPNAKQEYNVALSNYCDGVSQDEYYLFANSLAAGPYARGKKTEIGGYWEKLAVSALQHIILDEPGTDCGTKHYIEPKLTEDNISLYMYSYVIEGSKLVEITSQNKDKYIGKKVKMRFSSMCSRPNGKLCSKCAGNMFYRIGIKNVGVACSSVFSTMKNKCMKAFHDGTLQMVEIDPMKAFGIRE